jgi:hypothetical protein
VPCCIPNSEDAAYLGKGLVSCNYITEIKTSGNIELKPTPALWHVDNNGKAIQLGLLDGPFENVFTKGFYFFQIVGGDQFCLIRPAYPPEQKVLICKMNNDWKKSTNALSGIEPMQELLITEGNLGVGISAPPIEIEGIGFLIDFHVILFHESGHNPAKEYFHHRLLWRNGYIVGISRDVISWKTFGIKSEYEWIPGTSYYRNFNTDDLATHDRVYIKVTVGDYRNRWLRQDNVLANIAPVKPKKTLVIRALGPAGNPRVFLYEK